MGIFRLVLAMLVAVSHAGHNFLGYIPGVVAVISFYLLSGYVMSELIDKYYKKPSLIPMFYLDRAARIFPQFLFYIIVATYCIYVLNIDSHYTENLTPIKYFLNLFLIPQNYYMVNDWGDGAMVIPQAWSLGLELTFYLVIPFIVLYLTVGKIILLATCSFIFFAAYLGVINTDYFGYRLLPGTLFIFLIGWAFQNNQIESRLFRFVMCFLALILWLLALMIGGLQRPFNKEVLMGLLIGIIVINFLRNRKFSTVDEFLGNLSYGVFLNHFIIIWLMQKYYHLDAGINLYSTILFLFLSLIFAFISYYLVERPALKWRRLVRAEAISSS